jgi:hypothetical protein
MKALLRWVGPRHAEGPTSTRDETAVASSSNATASRPGRRLLDGQLIVSAPNLLHQPMSAMMTLALRS